MRFMNYGMGAPEPELVEPFGEPRLVRSFIRSGESDPKSDLGLGRGSLICLDAKNRIINPHGS